jgi:tetratricopeptide (TPR) repeat protein
MEWSALEGVLRCQPGNEQLHQLALILGGLASTATVIAAIYHLYRWLFPRPPKHAAAAALLRDEGKNRAQRGESQRAMELYDSSVHLNPGAGHVYYLRGLLHESDGNLARAIADWRRSLDRLPTNNPAEQKLIQYAAEPSREPPRYRWVYAYGVSGLVLIAALLGILSWAQG